VYRGAATYGLVKYLFGMGRRNEHADPRLVASWDGDPTGVTPTYNRRTGAFAVGQLAGLLDQPLVACPRHDPRHVYHLVLRTDADDRVLTDTEWAEVADEAMAATGLAPHGDLGGCRWAAVRHADDHIHVVATLARQDGRRPRHYNDFLALRQVCAQFEQRWGLRLTAGAEKAANIRPGVREQVTAEQRGRRQPVRVELRQKVRRAAARSLDWRSFLAELAAADVTVHPRYSLQHPDQLTGYSVSLAGYTDPVGNPIRYGGGKLAPDLTLPKLHARWGIDAAGTEGHGRRRVRHFPPGSSDHASDRQQARGPLSAAEREQAWRDAERIVADAAARIRAEASIDPDAAADAAWATGDTLTSTASVLEGDAGGPISDAAEAFDRASTELYGHIPTSSDTGRMLRSASRMIGILAVGARDLATQNGALLVALASLVAAVEDLRRAQERAHQAAAARIAADMLRHVAPPSRTDPRRPSSGRYAERRSDIRALVEESFAGGWPTSAPPPAGQRPPPGPPPHTQGRSRGR
jgi:hypothetical protein